jgi:hypothetical protein
LIIVDIDVEELQGGKEGKGEGGEDERGRGWGEGMIERETEEGREGRSLENGRKKSRVADYSTIQCITVKHNAARYSARRFRGRVYCTSIQKKTIQHTTLEHSSAQRSLFYCIIPDIYTAGRRRRRTAHRRA